MYAPIPKPNKEMNYWGLLGSKIQARQDYCQFNFNGFNLIDFIRRHIKISIWKISKLNANPT